MLDRVSTQCQCQRIRLNTTRFIGRAILNMMNYEPSQASARLFRPVL